MQASNSGSRFGEEVAGGIGSGGVEVDIAGDAGVRSGEAEAGRVATKVRAWSRKVVMVTEISALVSRLV